MIHRILKNLPLLTEASKLKIGDTRKRMGFEQKADGRFSYSLNPFRITRISHRYVVYQWIEFDRTGKAPNMLNLVFTEITVQDETLHAFDCEPFWVICKFASIK